MASTRRASRSTAWLTSYRPLPSRRFDTTGRDVRVQSTQPCVAGDARAGAGAGTSVIIYLAALGGVRPDLYEAAELDGAGVWSRVWHVTLPQIRGVILVLILLQLIGTMQVFNEPKLLTGGGPNNASISILMLIYQYGFVNSNYGAAAALSVMLAVVLAIVSIVYQFATRRLNDND